MTLRTLITASATDAPSTLRRLRAGVYRTVDGRFTVQHVGDREWHIDRWLFDHWVFEDARDTLRDCRAFITWWYSDD